MQNTQTFIEFGELLHVFAEQCRHAERFLRSDDTESEVIVNELATWVAERQAAVAHDLEHFHQQGSTKLVKRRLQFSPSYNAWSDPPDVAAAMQQTIDLNNAIANGLEKIAEISAPPEIEEIIRDLTRQVDAINRRISLGLVTSQDV